MTMLMNEAAYPSPAGDHRAEQLGLSKRELFAAKFMAAMMVGKSVYTFDTDDAEMAAATAAMAADALIAELSK